MMRQRLYGLAGAIMLLSVPAVAHAQMAPCAPHQALALALEASFGEQRVSVGALDSDRVLELWTTENGATWTLLAVNVEGMACIVATGTGWATAEPEEATPAVPLPAKRREA